MKKLGAISIVLLVLGSSSFTVANTAPAPNWSPQGQFSLIRRIEIGVPGSPVADIDVDGVGDINGDGVPDIIAGMSWADEGAGAAWVYSGADGTLLHAFEGTSAGDAFGVSVNGPGDLNADDVPDVVIGATGTNSGHGSITAFSGSDWSPLYTLNGGPSNWGLGLTVRDAPDADGDGIRELLVARQEPEPWDQAYIDVRSGADGEWLHSLGPIHLYSVFEVIEGSPVGDFNGDGVGDWGVYFANWEFDYCGEARVGSAIYSGSTSELLFSSPLEKDNCAHGRGGIAAAGDVNADGFDDFWMSWAGSKCGGTSVLGAVRLYLGPSGALDYTTCGDITFTGFGGSLTAIDDLNCDTVADFVVGAPISDSGGTNAGALHLIRGASGGELDTLDGAVVDGRLGIALANVGDINGDGPSDIAAISFQQPDWRPVIELINVQTGLNRCYLTRISQDQGFDILSAPSPDNMGVWWNAPSPYKYVGIYYGGSTRWDQKQLQLDEDWFAEAASYGWQFIPIWVGPMSPCRHYLNSAYDHMHMEPDLAEEDGRNEAHLAVDRAADLGLVGPSKNGTVIYYDLEGLADEDREDDRLTPDVLLQCTVAFQHFVTGWVSELHLLGNTAGVYALGGDVMSLTDYGGLEPDAIWIANWYDRPNAHYDQASVWDITHNLVPTTVWNDHNRLRQYARTHNDSYGGVELTSLDSNVADGLVAVIPGAMPVAVATPTPALRLSSPSQGTRDSQIDGMELITASDGWVWKGSQVLWTHTGGESWENITPFDLPGEAIMAVEFLDPMHGRLVSAEWQEVDATVQLYMSRTSDGGHTWTTQPFLDPDLTGYPSDVYTDLIDQLNGWVVVKQQTSSNASEGRLFRTDDGGNTWTRLTIPSGNPVRFVTSLHGWTLGGPLRDGLYETFDGGLSWTDHLVIVDVDWRYNIFSLPTFTSEQDGVLPFMGAQVDQTDVQFFVTHDGGDMWWPGASEHIDRFLGPVNHFPIEVIDLEHYVLPTSGGLPGQPGAVEDLSFISPDVGWALTGDGNCQEVGGEITCNPMNSLLATGDAGDTWQEVVLPLPSVYLPLVMR
jgi:hypothetical protein